jgi:hypothetical protein
MSVEALGDHDEIWYEFRCRSRCQKNYVRIGENNGYKKIFDGFNSRSKTIDDEYYQSDS